MVGLAEDQRSFYDILGVTKTDTVDAIKKAYRRLALKYHPDRNKSETAKEDFQFLGKIFNTLTNPRARKRYDKTGEAFDDESESFEEAYEYYRSVFKEITKEDIDAYAKTYKNSAAEKEDLFEAYTMFKGDMQSVIEWVPLCSEEDIPRFCEMIETALSKKKLKFKKKFLSSKKKISFADEAAEAEEAAEHAKEMGLDGSSATLFALIKRKKEKSKSFTDLLAEKYCSKGRENGGGSPTKSKKNKKKKKVKKSEKRGRSAYDIDDSEFEKLQKKMAKRSQKSKRKKK
eukprot:199608_1